MSAARILVTGGLGFIGAALVKGLLRAGHAVRVLDDASRGAHRRLRDVQASIEFMAGDIRDPALVCAALKGMDEVHHLAFVNGTQFFYSAPDLVLDVGVRGMLNVIDGCRTQGVGRLILASSSEVYHDPPRLPADETVPLVVPDPLNPRFSYSGGKIVSELLALNFGRRHFERVIVFRPHNIYGQDMGWEHVVPQFALRLMRGIGDHPSGPLPFPIQGSGQETRAFCHVEDLVAGVLVLRERGEHLGIYHIGTTEEVTIADLAHRMANCFGRAVVLEPGAARPGGPRRRCPDIGKLAALGFAPRLTLAQGLPGTVAWYSDHAHLAPLALSPPTKRDHIPEVTW